MLDVFHYHDTSFVYNVFEFKHTYVTADITNYLGW